MKYPKFWESVLSQTEFEIKHQYLRVRINNTALLPNNLTEGELSPFTDFIYWLLNHFNHYKTNQYLNRAEDDRNAHTLNILSMLFARDIKIEDLVSEQQNIGQILQVETTGENITPTTSISQEKRKRASISKLIGSALLEVGEGLGLVWKVLT